jgi:hypothetical protein
LDAAGVASATSVGPSKLSVRFVTTAPDQALYIGFINKWLEERAERREGKEKFERGCGGRREDGGVLMRVIGLTTMTNRPTKVGEMTLRVGKPRRQTAFYIYTNKANVEFRSSDRILISHWQAALPECLEVIV